MGSDELLYKDLTEVNMNLGAAIDNEFSMGTGHIGKILVS
jgi:hypothetical protein